MNRKVKAQKLAAYLISYIHKSDPTGHNDRITRSGKNETNIIEETADMLLTGNTFYIEKTLELYTVCNPDNTPRDLLNAIYAFKTENAPIADTSKRYIMADEQPCNFCDCNSPGGVCPYADKPVAERAVKCRNYLYFNLLKQYEHEKFDN